MIRFMGRGRPWVVVLSLLTFAAAAPARAQSYGEGADTAAPPADQSGWFDENAPAPSAAPAAAPEAQQAQPSAPAPDDADPRALT